MKILTNKSFIEIENQIHTLQINLNREQMRNDVLEKRRDELKAELKNKSEELKHLRNCYKQLEDINVDDEYKYNNLSTDYEQLKKENANLRRVNTRYRHSSNRIKEVIKENDKLKGRVVNQAHELLKDRIQPTINEYDKNLKVRFNK